MRFLFINFLLFYTTVNVFCQADSINLFYTSLETGDTTLFVIIKKTHQGALFVFPYEKGVEYFTFRPDSTLEKHRLPGSQSIYGPYKFKKRKNKIVFQDKNISKKYRDFYKLTDSLHLVPYLFSTSTDSYNIRNKLLDSNAVIDIGGISLKCFKFLQIHYGHSQSYDKYYRIVYIDKQSFLPFRIERYLDKECTWLKSVVFAKEYMKL